jgi:hypothetical protein
MLNFIQLILESCFVHLNHFLESVAPSLGVALLLLLLFIAQVTDALFQNVIPVSKVFLSKSIKVNGPFVTWVAGVLAAQEEEFKDFISFEN